jgi:HK97 family phage major capsid protein
VGVAPAYRPLPVAARIGCRIFTQRDNIAATKLSNPPAVTWIDGDFLAVDVADQDLDSDEEAPGPSTGILTTSWSRRLGAQAQPPIADVVEDDLRAAVAAAIDDGLINGTGTNGQPRGIRARVTASEISSTMVNGAVAFDDLAIAEAALGGADADRGPLAWLTSPSCRYDLRTTERAAGSGFILGDDGAPLGYPLFSSRHVPNDIDVSSVDRTELYLGAWNDVLVCVHAIEVVVDQFARKKQGIIEATAFVVVSIAVHRDASIHALTAITFTDLS